MSASLEKRLSKAVDVPVVVNHLIAEYLACKAPAFRVKKVSNFNLDGHLCTDHGCRKRKHKYNVKLCCIEGCSKQDHCGMTLWFKVFVCECHWWIYFLDRKCMLNFHQDFNTVWREAVEHKRSTSVSNQIHKEYGSRFLCFLIILFVVIVLVLYLDLKRHK